MAGAAHSLRLRARGPTRNGLSAGHSHPRRLCGQRITGRLVAANDAVSGPKPEAEAPTAPLGEANLRRPNSASRKFPPEKLHRCGGVLSRAPFAFISAPARGCL